MDRSTDFTACTVWAVRHRGTNYHDNATTTLLIPFNFGYFPLPLAHLISKSELLTRYPIRDMENE